MAFIFCDGFDAYGVTADFTKKGWVNSDVTDITFQSTSGKFGGGCVRILDDTADGLSRPIVLNEERFRISAWIYIDSGITVSLGSENNIFRFENSTLGTVPQWWLRLNASGLIEVSEVDDSTLATQATSSTDLRDSTWHHIEVHVAAGTLNIADGTIELWVDGVKEINQVGTVMTYGASGETYAGNLDKFILGCPAASVTDAVDYRVDDLVIWDDSGTDMTGHLSAVHRIETLHPNAEGNTTQFTPSTGTDNSALIDEAAADDADYVESSTSTHKDTNAFGNMSGSPTTIIGVVVNTRAINTDLGSISFKEKARSVATESNGTTHALSNAYAHYQHMFDDDPDAAGAWTGTTVDAAEFGYEVV